MSVYNGGCGLELMQTKRKFNNFNLRRDFKELFSFPCPGMALMASLHPRKPFCEHFRIAGRLIYSENEGVLVWVSVQFFEAWKRDRIMSHWLHCEKSGGYVLNGHRKVHEFMLCFFHARHQSREKLHTQKCWLAMGCRVECTPADIKNFCLRKNARLRCQKISLFRNYVEWDYAGSGHKI